MAKNNKKKKKAKTPFHAPKRMGEKTPILMTPMLWTMSAVSIALQLFLTGFAIFVATKWVPLEVVGPFGMNAGYVPLVLPIVLWVLTLVERIGIKSLPLDMWRMPVDVREGMFKCGSWLLKLVTLLIELECAAVFLYVDVCIYVGASPLDAVMLVWLAALALSVYLPCRYAGKLGRGEVTWTRGIEPETK